MKTELLDISVDLAELQKIISRGEDGQYQFKEDIRNIDSLAAEIVAFSNAKGGHIFIGVSDQGDLIGLSPADVRRAVEHWSKIQFIDNRDGCLFTVVIERAKVKGNANEITRKRKNDPINDQISPIQVQILDMVRENSRISYEDLTKKLNVSQATIKRNLQQLKLLKLLRYIGSKKTGHWEVLK